MMQNTSHTDIRVGNLIGYAVIDTKQSYARIIFHRLNIYPVNHLILIVNNGEYFILRRLKAVNL